MFTIPHLIWFCASICVIVTICFLLNKYKPSLNKVLMGCFSVAALSQLFITISEMQIAPSTDGETLRLYLPSSYLPLHMCSIQIFFIGLAMVIKKQPFKENLLAFMYATGVGGAAMALIICTVIDGSAPWASFVKPRAYEYHIYHCMLIIMGYYILTSGEVKFKVKHIFTTLAGILCAAWFSIYINSMLSVPHYENGKLISVDYNTNFFFTFEPPVNVQLTEVWHWVVYLLILLGAVLILEAILFIPPILIEKHKGKK